MSERAINKYDNVTLGKNVYLGEFCAIGCPKELTIRRLFEQNIDTSKIVEPVCISDNCIIGNHVCIHEGVTIGAQTVVEDHVRIGYGCKIGSNVRIMYGAYICDRVVIANDSRIAGFICDTAQIGERSTVMGNLVHEYSKPNSGWWDVEEPAPIIESDVVIGFSANVVGGIRISSRTYVAAGSIVTKDVPSNHVVKGTNELIPIQHWNGKKLLSLIKDWTDEK